MSDLISREVVLMFLREWTYCSDVEDLVLTLNAEPVQALIDAAVAAERERWEAMSQIDFANQSTARSIRNIDALIRKGEQP